MPCLLLLSSHEYVTAAHQAHLVQTSPNVRHITYALHKSKKVFFNILEGISVSLPGTDVKPEPNVSPVKKMRAPDPW